MYNNNNHDHIDNNPNVSRKSIGLLEDESQIKQISI